jgi:lipid-A-disaccharide synthase
MAGEASGDQHGAALAHALKSRAPNVELLGLGGPRMRAAGVKLLEGIDRLDIVGLPSPSELRQAIKTFRLLSRQIETLTLDAVVLIDNPGLNLRLARVAKRAGHRVVYYIAPQLWAWNRGRIRVIQQVVDRVLVILPFEEEIYRQAGIPCTFVGHPLMDELPVNQDVAALRRELAAEPGTSVVGLLPGSRKREVGMLLPIMLQAAARLAASTGPASYRFVIGKAAPLPQEIIDGCATAAGVPVTVWEDRAYDVMAAADALCVASGTATLQSALIGTPMTIVYRADPVTAFLARRLIRVKWLGLANLVAGRTIARELLQQDCTPDKLADATSKLLGDEEARAASRAVAAELREKLGRRGASERAADAILSIAWKR